VDAKLTCEDRIGAQETKNRYAYSSKKKKKAGYLFDFNTSGGGGGELAEYRPQGTMKKKSLVSGLHEPQVPPMHGKKTSV